MGRSLAGRGGPPRHPRRRRQDRGATAAAPRGRTAGTWHRGGGRRLRHRDRRRRALRMAAAVDGASEGLRTVVIEREAPAARRGPRRGSKNYLGFPIGCLRRPAREPRPAASAQTRRRDPRDPEITLRSTSPLGELRLDGGDVRRAAPSYLPAASSGGGSRQRASTASRGRASPTARRGVRRASSLRPGHPHPCGAGNSAGQAALFFSTHARSV